MASEADCPGLWPACPYLPRYLPGAVDTGLSQARPNRGLTLLTDIGEDSPMPAWSPDGGWIAFTGELGLYLVNVEEKRSVLLRAEQAFGVTWLPD